eukprot:13825905-Heterocapsa_arctica.AAC.1
MLGRIFRGLDIDIWAQSCIGKWFASQRGSERANNGSHYEKSENVGGRDSTGQAATANEKAPTGETSRRYG